jgi:hypothetical protein
MFQSRVLWLAFAFVAGLFLAGLPNWIAPYNRAGLFDPLMIVGLAGLAALAMMLVVGGIASPARAWATMAQCLPLAVAARIAVERLREPASHDLWTLEIPVAILVGSLAVLPGIAAGRFVQRLQNSRP